MSEPGLHWLPGLCAVVVVAAGLHWAQSVLAPVAFALFAIALVWPVQRAVQARAPQAVALLTAVLLTLIVLVLLALAIGWGFGRVARWVLVNAGQLQELYARELDWLEARGIGAAAALAGQFDMRQLARVAQVIVLQLQGVVGFLGLTLIFIILGLLEVEAAARQLAWLGRERPAAAGLLRALPRSAAKLRAYVLVRTVMSITTGLAVWAFAWLVGLDLAVEWGVIAFVLNYIPFIGSLLATVFPTLFAMLQFGTWQGAITVFLALQAIQFLSGSYLEPRLAGARLTLSPFLVLVSVFLGTLLWGIPGAFIGVPALITALTICEEFEGSRWVAVLLSGRAPEG